MLGDATIKIIDRQLEADFAERLRLQGHYLTGALERSIQSLISQTNDGFVLEVSANDYIEQLDTGVPASQINTADRSYIEGLKNYAKLRFGITDERQAYAAAYAIARKHAKEGMPTKSSYQYSQTGSRTQVIEETMNVHQGEYDKLMEQGISDELDRAFEMGKDVIL